jgi:hypothetical protein
MLIVKIFFGLALPLCVFPGSCSNCFGIMSDVIKGIEYTDKFHLIAEHDKAYKGDKLFKGSGIKNLRFGKRNF